MPDGTWAESTGPGCDGLHTGGWEAWLITRRTVGDDQTALDALGWTEAPEIPANRRGLAS